MANVNDLQIGDLVTYIWDDEPKRIWTLDIMNYENGYVRGYLDLPDGQQDVLIQPASKVDKVTP